MSRIFNVLALSLAFKTPPTRHTCKSLTWTVRPLLISARALFDKGDVPTCRIPPLTVHVHVPSMQFRLIILAQPPSSSWRGVLSAFHTHNGIYLQCERNITVPEDRGVRRTTRTRTSTWNLGRENIFPRRTKSDLCRGREGEFITVPDIGRPECRNCSRPSRVNVSLSLSLSLPLSAPPPLRLLFWYGGVSRCFDIAVYKNVSERLAATRARLNTVSSLRGRDAQRWRRRRRRRRRRWRQRWWWWWWWWWWLYFYRGALLLHFPLVALFTGRRRFRD